MWTYTPIEQENIGELRPLGLNYTFLPQYDELSEVAILLGGFLIVLIVMFVLLYFLKKKTRNAVSVDQTEVASWKKGTKIASSILIALVTLSIVFINFGRILLYYECFLYVITHVVLILSLYNIIMIYMYGKSEKDLKIGKVLLIISSILVLSNIVFYAVTMLI